MSQNHIQVNCERFRQVIFNGRPYVGCLGLKQFLTPDNIGEFCLGDKCPLPKYEVPNLH